jgi:hypothetical protein
LADLRQNAGSDDERAEIESLARALGNCWTIFNREKQEEQLLRSDSLPADLTFAVEQLHAQTRSASGLRIIQMVEVYSPSYYRLLRAKNPPYRDTPEEYSGAHNL